MKIYIVGGDESYASWISTAELVDTISESDLVLFTGGEDVSPSIYGEPTGSKTHCNAARDKYEIQKFRDALTQRRKILSICRGSQLMCALAGGRLIQHVTNHAKYGTHSVTFSTGEEVNLTSTHHQMMFPFNLNHDKYKLLAWSTEKLSDTYLNGQDKEKNELLYELSPSLKESKYFKEPEIVYFRDIKALAIQAHPEIMHSETEGRKKCLELVNSLMNNTL